MNEQEKRNYRPDFELLWGCWDHNRRRRTPRLAAREPEAEILNSILLSNFPLIYISMSYIILSDQKVQRRSWYSFPFLPSNESLDVLLCTLLYYLVSTILHCMAFEKKFWMNWNVWSRLPATTRRISSKNHQRIEQGQRCQFCLTFSQCLTC